MFGLSLAKILINFNNQTLDQKILGRVRRRHVRRKGIIEIISTQQTLRSPAESLPELLSPGLHTERDQVQS